MTMTEELLALLDELPGTAEAVDVEFVFEMLGMYDHDGLREFAAQYGWAVADGDSALAEHIAAGIGAGFFLGLSYARKHPLPPAVVRKGGGA